MLNSVRGTEMRGGWVVISGNSCEVDGSSAIVSCEFVCDSSSGGCGFVLALNHICDYD